MGIKHKKSEIVVKKTILNKGILNAFWNESLIRGYKSEGTFYRVYLKYNVWGESLLKKISTVSKPGKRVYTGFCNKSVKLNSILFINTPLGIFSLKDLKCKGVGGEVLISVYF